MKANLVVVVLAALFFFAGGARADEVAPSLEGADLRVRAADVLRGLVTAKPDAKLRGIYAAFDSSVADPNAMAACDDDGDYVIVMSDAMLRLVGFVARLSVDDESNGTHKLEEYAAHLAQNQMPGKRVLPPAAGTYASGVDLRNEGRWNEIMAFLYARELAHLRARELVCPNPTVTKERGDDAWTAAEAATARVTASALYPGKQTERDAAAVAEGQSETGAVELLRFFAHFETASAKVTPAYLTLHPHSAARLAAIRTKEARP